jgi:hypothetical protein
MVWSGINKRKEIVVNTAMYAKMGLKAVDTASSLLLQSTQRKMLKDAQEHRNLMSALSSAQQMNDVTFAEIQTQDDARQLKREIDLAAMQDQGAAEVSAAASGVAGGSVENTMRALKRSAANANYARIKTVDSRLNALGNNKKNITLQKVYGEDVRVFQKPNISVALLGLTTDVIDIYNQNQPQGQGAASVASKLLGGTGKP